MDLESQSRTMEPLYQRAERLVKQCKALQKKHLLESAQITLYRGDEFLSSAQATLKEARNCIRGYIYQGYDVSFGVTGVILDVVVSRDA